MKIRGPATRYTFAKRDASVMLAVVFGCVYVCVCVSLLFSLGNGEFRRQSRKWVDSIDLKIRQVKIRIRIKGIPRNYYINEGNRPTRRSKPLGDGVLPLP